jgi:hypothetical protein
MRGIGSSLLAAIAFIALAPSSPAWPEAGQASASEPASPVETQRVLRIADCAGEGLTEGEAFAVRNLITSYAVELKMFRVIDSSGQELALREAETAVQLGQSKDLAPLVADYILSSRMDPIGTQLLFSMDVVKTATGEKKSVSEAFASENDLLLAVRRLTRKLFERPEDAPPARVESQSSQGQDEAAKNPLPNLSLIAGTWKGDKNLDRVTLMPDGTGFAVLASGRRMALKISIEGASIIVAQNQPNSPDFYRPNLDYKSAKVVAQSARPWRWTFSLSADGTTLSGVKESVFVTVSKKGEVALDNNYVRDAVWTRLYQ